MPFAERYAFPIDAEIGTSIPRTNDFKELFYVRWASIRFAVSWGNELNLKVVLNVYRSDDICERFIVDTDAQEIQWNRHRRVTRDFYVHPFPQKLGPVRRITFSFIIHLQNRSIPSQHEYVLIEGETWRTIAPSAGRSRRRGWSPIPIARESWMGRNCSETWTGATSTSNYCT